MNPFPLICLLVPISLVAFMVKYKQSLPAALASTLLLWGVLGLGYIAFLVGSSRFSSGWEALGIPFFIGGAVVMILVGLLLKRGAQKKR